MLSSKNGNSSGDNTDNKGLLTSSSKENQIDSPQSNDNDEQISHPQPSSFFDNKQTISSRTIQREHMFPKHEEADGDAAPSRSSDHYHGRSRRHADLNPEANLHATNFPPDFGEEQLREMFSPFGKIIRLRYVKATNDQETYGLIQFEHVEDCQRALEKYKDYEFNEHYKLKLSLVQRRTSSLSEEPTNLYVRNLPKHWNEDQLRHLFNEFGKILQCRIVSDGIAFVRLDDHVQATTAIDALHGKAIGDCQLEVKFANRKTAAEHYKTGQTFHKENKNNLYVRYLPLKLSQRDLEEMFGQFGKISSAKMNESGIAFVRYVNAEDAQKAIKGLHNKKMEGSEPLVVRLAYYDIGDPRNRLCVQIRNLPVKMSVREVEKLVVKYGKAAAVKVNEENGEAFVRYANVDDAEEASKQMNGLFIEGSTTALSAKVIFYDTNVSHSQRQQSSRGRGASFTNRGPAYSSGRHQTQGQHLGAETLSPSNNSDNNVSNNVPTAVNPSNVNNNNTVNSTPLIVPQTGTTATTAATTTATGTGNKYFTTNMGVNYSSPTTYSGPFVMTGSPGTNPVKYSSTTPLFNSNNNPTTFDWASPAPMWSTLGVPLLNTSIPVQFVNTSTNMNNTPSVNSNANPLTSLSTNLQIPVLSMPTLKPSTNTSLRNYSQQQQMLGDQLYQYIKLKHPQYVAKLTGMILTMNAGDEDQVRNLLNNPVELDLECEKLVQLLKSKQSQTSQGLSNTTQTTQSMVNPTLQPNTTSTFLSPLMTTGNLDPNLLTTYPSSFGVMPNFQAPVWSGTTTLSTNTNYNFTTTDPGANNTTQPN